MTFGEKLKGIREAQGLSQPALAEASGVPVGTIRMWEQERRSPNWQHVQRIAGALGVSCDSLKDDPPEPDSA